MTQTCEKRCEFLNFECNNDGECLNEDWEDCGAYIMQQKFAALRKELEDVHTSHANLETENEELRNAFAFFVADMKQAIENNRREFEKIKKENEGLRKRIGTANGLLTHQKVHDERNPFLTLHDMDLALRGSACGKLVSEDVTPDNKVMPPKSEQGANTPKPAEPSLFRTTCPSCQPDFKKPDCEASCPCDCHKEKELKGK